MFVLCLVSFSYFIIFWVILYQWNCIKSFVLKAKTTIYWALILFLFAILYSFFLFFTLQYIYNTYVCDNLYINHNITAMFSFFIYNLLFFVIWWWIILNTANYIIRRYLLLLAHYTSLFFLIPTINLFKFLCKICSSFSVKVSLMASQSKPKGKKKTVLRVKRKYTDIEFVDTIGMIISQ